MSDISFSITLDDLCLGERPDHASLIEAFKSSKKQGELWDRIAAATLSAICEEMERPCSDAPQIYDPDILHRNFIAARGNLDKTARHAFFNINSVEKAAEQRPRDCPWYPDADHAIRIVEAVRALAKAHRAIRDYPWRTAPAGTKPKNAPKS